MNRTRTIATLGPASSDARTIRALIEAGVDIFRLNFSHGARAEHARTIERIRATAAACRVRVGILADLQGPKIRTGRTPDDAPVKLETGDTVRILDRSVVCTASEFCTDQPGLVAALAPGQRVLLNDGAVGLRVESVDTAAGVALARIEHGGVYASRKGVNLPGTHLPIPSLTEKDRADLAVALDAGVPWIALSFVRGAEDVRDLRRAIDAAGGSARIVAKIEKPEAVEAIGDILEASDGIMVARGDLGIELSPHELPVVQKHLVDAANRRGRIAIVATQMLESMVERPLPTRAEAADVANAILDGADAVMLSAETSIGRYPVEAAAMMGRIAKATEASAFVDRAARDLSVPGARGAHAMCEAAAWASRDLQAAPVAILTLSGETAFYFAKLRSPGPAYAFTPDAATAEALALAWNIRTFEIPFERDFLALEEAALRQLAGQGFVRSGDPVLLLSGRNPVPGETNSLRVLLAP